jgi:hypothetical protein
MMDNQFEPIRGGLGDIGVGLNEAGRDEHVGQVESYIRTIKELVRVIYNMLPFKQMPPVLVIEMVKVGIFWLHASSNQKEVSDDISPRGIVTG